MIRYRLTETGRNVTEKRIQELSLSDGILDLLLENPEQSAEELARQLERPLEDVKRVLSQHIHAGKVIGVGT